MSTRSAIVIPIYNQERFLDRALDSLAAQTCREFVVIAVDDGSTDSSSNILKRRGVCPNIDLTIVMRPNGGVSAARNTGLEAALAMSDVDSVMFLDPDDRYLPSCVEKARAAHAATPDAVVEWLFAMGSRDCSKFSSHARLEPNIWSKLYPLDVVADVRFFEGADIAEDLAFNLEVEHRHHPRIVQIHEPLYFYETNVMSAMHRALTERDFRRRAAIVAYICSIFSDDQKALETVSRNEIPELLKQFWRDLMRVVPSESRHAHRVFVTMISDLRQRGLLHPKMGRIKDLKYYLRFLLMK